MVRVAPAEPAFDNIGVPSEMAKATTMPMLAIRHVSVLSNHDHIRKPLAARTTTFWVQLCIFASVYLKVGTPSPSNT